MAIGAQDLDHVLAYTETLWRDLRGHRIFLTGATGFFGRWLLETYLAAHDRFGLHGEISILTRDPAAFAAAAPEIASHRALRVIGGQQASFELPEQSYHSVIHSAVEYGDAWTIAESNLLGMHRVLELARRAGAERVLFMSSGAVYRRQASDPALLPEDHAGAPAPLSTASAYAQVKRMSEALGAAAAERHGFEFKVARGFAFLGPYLALDRPSAISNFIGDAMRGSAIEVRGDGTAVRSYLYAADLAIWLWTILIKGGSARAYNVGSDQAFALSQVAEHVAAQVTPRVAVEIKQTPVPGAAVDVYVPSIERCRRELGLAPRISLDEAIRRTIQFHRERTR